MKVECIGWKRRCEVDRILLEPSQTEREGDSVRSSATPARPHAGDAEMLGGM